MVQNEALVGMIAIGDFATRHIFHNEAGQALRKYPSHPNHEHASIVQLHCLDILDKERTYYILPLQKNQCFT